MSLFIDIKNMIDHYFIPVTIKVDVTRKDHSQNPSNYTARQKMQCYNITLITEKLQI